MSTIQHHSTDQNLNIPSIPVRTTTTLQDVIAGNAAALIGAKVLRLDCLPVLQTLASLEQSLITLKDSNPRAVVQALEPLQQVGTLIARCEYDRALFALNAYPIDPVLLPDTSKPRAIRELLRAQAAMQAQEYPLHASIAIAEGALRRLQECNQNETSREVFQAQTLMAIQVAKLDSKEFETNIRNFGAATNSFLQLSDSDKLLSVRELRELTLALFKYYPYSQVQQRSTILHQIHGAISSKELYNQGCVNQKFQLELTRALMAPNSCDFLFQVHGSDPDIHSSIATLGQKVLDSCRHEFGKSAPMLTPQFTDMLNVAKLCYDFREFEIAYAIADYLCVSAGLDRIQQRDSLLEACKLRLLVRPEIPDTMGRNPSLKQLRDLTRRDFRGDQDALDQIEIAYGELLAALASQLPRQEPSYGDLPENSVTQSYPMNEILTHTIAVEEIAQRKGIRETLRLSALELLEELYRIRDENDPLSFD